MSATIPVLDFADYRDRLLAAERPGVLEKVTCFYDHRVGAICTDPRLMLMPWDDHLVHRGDGVFETCKFKDGKLYQLEPHLERMQRSSASIFLDPPCGWDEVEQIILNCCAVSMKTEAGRNGGVRVILGRGPGGFGIDLTECPVPSLYVVCYHLAEKPEAKYERGLTAARTSIPAKQSWIATIKSLDYLPNVLMRREADEKGVDVTVCFDDHGHLAEGAIENVCLVDAGGTLVVPEFTSALAGTTMLRGIELMQEEMPFEQRTITEQDIFDAREFMAVGTTVDAISIVEYAGRSIGEGVPGPVARRMREKLQADLVANGTPIPEL